jgi:hypothetical protein
MLSAQKLEIDYIKYIKHLTATHFLFHLKYSNLLNFTLTRTKTPLL